MTGGRGQTGSPAAPRDRALDPQGAGFREAPNVFVSMAATTNHQKLHSLKQQKFIFLHFWNQGSAIRCPQGPAPSECSLEGSFLASGRFHEFLGLWLPLSSVCLCHHVPCPSCLCVPSLPRPFCHKDPYHWIEGPPR